MKTTLLLIATSALWALTSAHPRAAAAAVSRRSGGGQYAALVPRTNENGTSIVADDEPVPVFQLACDCPAVVCDPRMNAKSVGLNQPQPDLPVSFFT